MADWGILRNSTGKEYLSLCGHEISSIHAPMMNDLDLTSGSVYIALDSQVDENTFCTVDNIDQCLSFLNQELLSLGFMSVGFDGNNRTTSLINRLYELLRLYQKHGRVKEELENRLHKVTSQSDHYQAAITRLKNDVDRLKREVCKEQEKYRQVAVKQKSLSIKLKTEKDEIKRLQSIVKDRDAQFRHELKKKERECNKLKEKIHQLLADKTPNRRVGLDMAYSIQSTDGKRSTWKTGSSNKQEEMYQYMIGTYEDKQRQLMVENSELRESINKMQKDISIALRLTDNNLSSNVSGSENVTILSSQSEDSDNEEDGDRSKSLTEGYLQLPYEMIRENVEHSIHDRCKKIRQKKKSRRKLPNPKGAKSSPSKSPTSSGNRKEDIELIHNQIDKYKDIIQQQEQLIKQFIQRQTEAVESHSFLHDSQLLQERETLTEQRRLFYTEKANFEKERRQLTEEAIRLGKERRAVEDEKANILRTQFLQLPPPKYDDLSRKSTPHKGSKIRILPATPLFSPAPLDKRWCTSASRRSKRLKKNDNVRLLPSTPLFSPAPTGPVKTPSTAELMKFLGITKDLNSSNRSTPLSHKKGRQLRRSVSSESLIQVSDKSVTDLNDFSNEEEEKKGNAKKTLFLRRSSTGNNDDLGI